MCARDDVYLATRSIPLFSHMAESNEGRIMATPLSDCTIEEQCAIVRFLWAEGVKSVEIHCRMLAQYGAGTMHQRKIYEWIECF
jgi:hypothetical protein